MNVRYKAGAASIQKIAGAPVKKPDLIRAAIRGLDDAEPGQLIEQGIRLHSDFPRAGR